MSAQESVASVEGDTGVLDALELMRHWGIRHLPVFENKELKGLLSERDVYRYLSIKGRDNYPVTEVMSHSPYRVGMDEDLSEVLQEMVTRKIGCVIVESRPNQLAGLFSTVDAMKLFVKMLSSSDLPDQPKMKEALEIQET